jgi:hypothetical protein
MRLRVSLLLNANPGIGPMLRFSGQRIFSKPPQWLWELSKRYRDRLLGMVALV